MVDVGTVTVVRDASGRTAAVATRASRMHILSESGKFALLVDYAPREIEYGGLALDWAQADRSGEKPLLLHKAVPLKTMSFSFLMADRSLQRPQTSKIAQLVALAGSTERVVVRFSPTEQGLWRITDCKVSSEQRTDATDEVARATVSLTLTQASDPAAAVGPISKPKSSASTKSVGRSYTVKKGDSLWAIAKRYYGAGSKWPRIFDANRNKIKNPNLIYPGQTFTIP